MLDIQTAQQEKNELQKKLVQNRAKMEEIVKVMEQTIKNQKSDNRDWNKHQVFYFFIFAFFSCVFYFILFIFLLKVIERRLAIKLNEMGAKEVELKKEISYLKEELGKLSGKPFSTNGMSSGVDIELKSVDLKGYGYVYV
jgi:hypothetical protein